ncbi:MAG: hypothetical protein A2X87_01645 [Deltaproteobacteria bacterium GWC2_42_51]|nr:MAG: hypothetical protein A2056_00105 [Deltaproteobacteria bacterium GWA2_42_85]OGP26822.1 MAG: hypothetical protein A2067_07325 [Deltaproteobacteria bacterium GWB2_42_7]OGP32471.1 MAG: hypothetical protein A2X87_01645 [Deltaproteobacteria bacterium GWC2_42_51]OGP48735.1 MAG: hypothetical protein A2022_05460 [Deltaproteobacteria bacterium GWF2_42_12]OGQ24196.1 MAG: hypothetical protein A3D29_08885 [Deltaproteobacteria bacterium RIFCSPHIGHO2_02_FULL_42_44]OGQ64473.1 MAG: hypothetical protein
MFYKIIIECGHMGAGNGLERIWFIKGENPLVVLQKARKLPRVKRKETSLAIKLIQEISKEEYISGINNYREARLYQG